MVRCQLTQAEIKLTLALLPGVLTGVNKHSLGQKNLKPIVDCNTKRLSYFGEKASLSVGLEPRVH